MLHLHENIKLIRLLSGKTQPEFGKMFDATKSMIISYEQGRAKPNELFTKRISEYAGVTIQDLINKKLNEKDIYLHLIQKEQKVPRETHESSRNNKKSYEVNDFDRFVVSKLLKNEALLELILSLMAEDSARRDNIPVIKKLDEYNKMARQKIQDMLRDYEL